MQITEAIGHPKMKIIRVQKNLMNSFDLFKVLTSNWFFMNANDYLAVREWEWKWVFIVARQGTRGQSIKKIKNVCTRFFLLFHGSMVNMCCKKLGLVFIDDMGNYGFGNILSAYVGEKRVRGSYNTHMRCTVPCINFNRPKVFLTVWIRRRCLKRWKCFITSKKSLANSDHWFPR